MALILHNPGNQAHLEDLRDRLGSHLAQGPADPYGRAWFDTVIGTLVETVQAMDQGTLSESAACEVFQTFRIPGFRFERWLAEMVDEGVYLETMQLQAA
jgi:hypothetical protein